MKKQKLTPWFQASVKPVRDGVYQCDYSNFVVYRMFKNGQWRCFGNTVKEAAKNWVPSDNQVSWRGLAVKP